VHAAANIAENGLRHNPENILNGLADLTNMSANHNFVRKGCKNDAN